MSNNAWRGDSSIWAKGEPNNNGGNERCIAYVYSRWNDADCNSALYFVIEYECQAGYYIDDDGLGCRRKLVRNRSCSCINLSAFRSSCGLNSFNICSLQLRGEHWGWRLGPCAQSGARYNMASSWWRSARHESLWQVQRWHIQCLLCLPGKGQRWSTLRNRSAKKQQHQTRAHRCDLRFVYTWTGDFRYYLRTTLDQVTNNWVNFDWRDRRIDSSSLQPGVSCKSQICFTALAVWQCSMSFWLMI